MYIHGLFVRVAAALCPAFSALKSDMEEKPSTFKKKEKLKSQKAIARLFREGQAFHLFPFRWVWVEAGDAPHPVQVAVSVSKRKFKRAVDRNRIKRLVREAWRLNKAGFYEKLGPHHFHIMFIYTGKELPEWLFLERKMRKGMQVFLEKEWPKHHSPQQP